MAFGIAQPARAAETSSHEMRDVYQTTCCIVGGGPAGAVLALLLVRQGIAVTLLEAHADFDRDFRGDTLHPSILAVPPAAPTQPAARARAAGAVDRIWNPARDVAPELRKPVAMPARLEE